MCHPDHESRRIAEWIRSLSPFCADLSAGSPPGSLPRAAKPEASRRRALRPPGAGAGPRTLGSLPRIYTSRGLPRPASGMAPLAYSGPSERSARMPSCSTISPGPIRSHPSPPIPRTLAGTSGSPSSSIPRDSPTRSSRNGRTRSAILLSIRCSSGVSSHAGT